MADGGSGAVNHSEKANQHSNKIEKGAASTEQGIEGKVWAEIAFAQIPGSLIGQNDQELLRDWDKFHQGKNIYKTGLFNNIREGLSIAGKEQVEALGFAPYTKGDTIPNIRDNIRQIRLFETDHAANPTWPVMKEFDFAFLAVGTRATVRPPGFSNEYLSILEAQRLSERTHDYVKKLNGGLIAEGRTPEIKERDVLSTIIFENLRPVFPMDRPWTDNKPWTDAEQKVAANQLQLNPKDYKNDLDRLHKRYLVASVFRAVNETGRAYGQQSNRDANDQFVYNHLAKDLNLVASTKAGLTQLAWTPAIQEAVMMKYGVTREEANQLREAVSAIADRITP